MTVMTVTESKGDLGGICGAKKRQGEGVCTQVAGWGTDHVGVGRCKLHGGSTGDHRRNARRIVAMQDCNRFGLQVDTDPGEALIQAVREAAANVEFLRTLVEDLYPGLTKAEDGSVVEGIAGRTFHVSGRATGEAKPHVYVQMYNAERDRLAQYATAALKAGVDERRLRMEETETRTLFQAHAQAAIDAGLTEEQMAVFQRSFARRLREASGEAIEVESGEIVNIPED